MIFLIICHFVSFKSFGARIFVSLGRMRYFEVQLMTKFSSCYDIFRVSFQISYPYVLWNVKYPEWLVLQKLYSGHSPDDLFPQSDFWKTVIILFHVLLFSSTLYACTPPHTEDDEHRNFYFNNSQLQVWNTRYTRVHKHTRLFTCRNVCVFIYFCEWSFTHRTVGLQQPLSRRIGEAIAVGI